MDKAKSDEASIFRDGNRSLLRRHVFVYFKLTLCNSCLVNWEKLCYARMGVLSSKTNESRGVLSVSVCVSV